MGNKKFYTNWLLMPVLALFIYQGGYAQIEKVKKSFGGNIVLPGQPDYNLNNKSIVTGAVQDVRDQWYTTYAASYGSKFNTKASAANIVLRYEEAKHVNSLSPWYLRVTYDITYDTWSGSAFVPHYVPAETIDIYYDPAVGASYKDISLNRYPNALRAKVTIMQVDFCPNQTSLCTAPSTTIIPSSLNYPDPFIEDIIMDVEIETDRYVIMGTLSTNTVTVNASSVANNQLPISWTYSTSTSTAVGAQSFDVEWVFIDNYPQAYTSPPSNTGLAYDFANATRVNVKGHSYNIPLTYPAGFIVYRVRPVTYDQNNSNIKVDGAWSVPSSTGTLGSLPTTVNCKISWHGVDKDKNWQYAATYAEDGKRKEVVNYFDGTLRQRQMSTELSTDTNIVIQETNYDFEGRKAMEILPSPLKSTGIHYYNAYSSYDDKNNYDNATTLTNPTPVSNTMGSSKYFSSLNNVWGINIGYLPDAAGYVFSRTTYMNDGTNQVKSQSSPGHELTATSSNNRSVKYYYGKPTSQAEIDAMFGNEVGALSHYNKQMTIDQNGQTSFTYTDMHGRTIATCISGSTPTNLISVDNKPSPITVTDDLLDGNNIYTNNNELTSTTSLLVDASQTYSFNYTLGESTYCELCNPPTEGGGQGSTERGTGPGNYCKDCKYTLTISIADDDGTYISGISFTGSTNGTSGQSYSANPLILTGITSGSYAFSVTLPPGSYTVKKTLTPETLLSTVANDPNFASSMAACLPNSSISISGCANDCQSACHSVYEVVDFNGNVTGYVDENHNTISSTLGLQYINDCIAACNNNATSINSDNVPSECDRKLQMIKEDMSPGGQYFDNLHDENATGYDPNDWLDIAFGTTAFSPIQSYLGITITSWSDVRANWNDGILNVSVGGHFFYTYHPEYQAYDFFCNGGLSCPGDGKTSFGVNYTMLSRCYDEVTANLGSTQLSGTSGNAFFNPLNSTWNNSASSPADYCPSTYANSSTPSTSCPATPYSNNSTLPMAPTDPFIDAYSDVQGCEIKLCSTGSGQSIQINSSDAGVSASMPDVLSYNLFHFLEFQDKTTSSITYTYSIWYVMEDPNNIHSLTTSSSIPDAIIAFFQSIHGDGTTGSVGAIDPSDAVSKYTWFRSYYQMYKQYLIYQYFKFKFPTYAFCQSPGNGYSVGSTGGQPNPYFACRYPQNDFYENNMTMCSACATGYSCVPGKISFEPSTSTSVGTTLTNDTATIMQQCRADCYTSAQNWMDQYKPCLDAYNIHQSGAGATTYADIMTALTHVCEANCYVITTGNGGIINGSSGCVSGGPPNSPSCSGISGTYGSLSFASFDEVINYYLTGSKTTVPTHCDFRLYYPSIAPNDPDLTQDQQDGSCSCSNLVYYVTNSSDFTTPIANPYDPSNYATIASTLNTVLGVTTYSVPNVTAWMAECNKYKPALSNLTAQIFPAMLQCSMTPVYTKESCTVSRFKDFLNAIGILWKSSYNTAASSSDPDIVLIADKVRLFINPAVTNTNVYNWMTNSSGLFAATPSITYLTGQAFPNMFVCPDPASTSQTDVDAAIALANCELQSLLASAAYAASTYGSSVTSLATDYTNHFNDFCINNLLDNQLAGTPIETFSVTYSRNQFLYTLYYYDQAADLIKTVPPNGVNLLYTSSDLLQVKHHRNNPSSAAALYPLHTYVTNYKYDHQDKILSQNTPDGGTTTFYYDKKHQLLCSKNAKQAAQSPAMFSYTNYDALGRIIEVGQMEPSSAVALTNDVTLGFDAANQTALNALLTCALPCSKKQITTTWYDAQQAAFGASGSYALGTLLNTRNRVAQTTLDDNGDGNYESASHYSYDIHGNVNHLYQENKDPQLALMGHTVKQIDYKYDVISGKVNEVHYQSGYADQFHHKYSYDADNRITLVQTSSDGLLYFKEAKYFYYPHGPLSRAEVGDKQVQGSDYAYTLQGWIKGVNASTLMTNRDIGQDGLSKYVRNNIAGTSMNRDHLFVNSNFGGDAYGYSLDYFLGDYSSVNSPTAIDNFLPGFFVFGTNTLYNNQVTYGLYNGNISRMTNAITDYAEVPQSAITRLFKYDQLNRIRYATAYSQSGMEAINLWTGGAADNVGYDEEFHFDFNGNISSAKRYGAANTLMDDMAYGYNGYLEKNQLIGVIDAASPSAYTDDFDGGFTGPPMYGYDEIGNLQNDHYEQIETNYGLIDWSVYGKIRSVKRGVAGGTITKSDLQFKYDPSGNRIAKIEKTRVSGTLQNEDHWAQTYYVRDAQGNTLATYNLTFSPNGSNSFYHRFKLIETPIYGSSRLGYSKNLYAVTTPYSVVGGSNFNTDGTFHYGTNTNSTLALLTPTSYSRTLGTKSYEFSNHLGNVMSVVSDRKLLSQTNIDNEEEDFEFTTNASTAHAFEGTHSDHLFLPPGGSGLSVETFGKQVIKEVKPGDYIRVNLQSYNPNNASVYIVMSFLGENNHYLKDNGTTMWYFQYLPTGGTWQPTSLPNVSSLSAVPSSIVSYAPPGGVSSLYIKLPTTTGSTGITLDDGVTTPTKYYVSLGAWNADPSHADIYVDKMEVEIVHNPTGTQSNPISELDHYTADVTTAQDYYAYGQPMRYSNPSNYRYGFNGKENDIESVGTGQGVQDYGKRIYNPALGRFLSVDPLASSYPSYAPYIFAGNDPLYYIDQEGGEQIEYTVNISKNGEVSVSITYYNDDNWPVFDYKRVIINYDGQTATYYFSPWGTNGDHSSTRPNGGGYNNLDQFDEFVKDPLGAMQNPDLTTEEEIKKDMVKDILASLIIGRLVKQKDFHPTQTQKQQNSGMGKRFYFSANGKYSSTRYRENLQNATGKTGKGYDAHHTLPKGDEFTTFFGKANLDPHNPKNMIWRKSTLHSSTKDGALKSREHLKLWKDFMQRNPNASQEQILRQRDIIENKVWGNTSGDTPEN